MERKDVLARAEELGIELSHKTEKTASVIKKIEDLTGEKIVVETVKKTEKEVSDTVRCIIHSNDKDNDEIEAYFGINGDNIQVLLGEEIDFPKKFLPCVSDASVEEKIAILNDAGEVTGKYRERVRKNYILERV